MPVPFFIQPPTQAGTRVPRFGKQGSGQIDMRQMVRAGVLLNLLGVALISLFLYFVSSPLPGVDLSAIPAWAGPSTP